MDVHRPPEHSMEGKRKRARKPRTRFSPAELRALRDAFQKNMSPGRAAIQNLASETGLDTYVVQVWFKNQRAKRKRMNPGSGSLPPPKRQAGSERDRCSPQHSLESSPSSVSTCSPLNLGAPLPTDGEHSRGAGAPHWSPALDSEPKEPLDEIHLDVSEALWECITENIDEFTQMYLSPGDDDFSELDQYLFPEDCDSVDGSGDNRHQTS